MPAIAKQVYVISDLHLGGVYSDQEGERGFRICTHVTELTTFIDRLTAKPSSGPRIELVINGDLVDFLAERETAAPHWRPFTPDQERAVDKLAAIAKRDSAFFEALAGFLGAGHRLVLTIGNHDIELCFPLVRRKLESLLGVDRTKDYRLIYDGEAYVVGDALIEHGNRYDPWNVLDYDALRRYRSLLSRRQPIPDKYIFDPPAGSKMVSEVINPVKEEYRFIDLLKPENEAAIPMLMVLEPGFRSKLGTVAKHALFQARKHGTESAAMPSYGGDISTDGDDDGYFGDDIGATTPQAPVAAPDALEEALRKTLGDDAPAFLSNLGADSESSEDYGADISTMESIDRGIGMLRLLLGSKHESIEKRLPLLLKGLRALQNDKSFDRAVENASEYANAARGLAAGGFRYVLFGHTHLAKNVQLDGGAVYLNSGTWADLIRVPDAIVSGSDQEATTELRAFVESLKESRLDRWITFQPTFLRLDLGADDKVAHAELIDYSGPESLGG
jgi:UDP-2,3-diacylglucosamine pyrophosphatase LpxH